MGKVTDLPGMLCCTCARLYMGSAIQSAGQKSYSVQNSLLYTEKAAKSSGITKAVIQPQKKAQPLRIVDERTHCHKTLVQPLLGPDQEGIFYVVSTTMLVGVLRIGRPTTGELCFVGVERVEGQQQENCPRF
jgi:hypothetical protein